MILGQHDHSIKQQKLLDGLRLACALHRQQYKGKTI